MALDRRKVRYGSSAAIASLALVGALTLTNVLAQMHFRRWDWTASRIYTLSDKTRKLLHGLTTDVETTVLIQPSAEMYDDIHELLQKYAAESGRIKLEFLDPASQPARVEQILKTFGIDRGGDTTAVVFSSGTRHKHVSINELAEYDMAMAGMGGAPRVKSFKGESAFTSAILSVIESTQSGICFVKGHDELPVADSDAAETKGLGELKKELERENLKAQTTDALGRSPVPADCNVLVIAGPTRGFTSPEAAALGQYLDAGGRLLALIDPVFARDGTIQPLGIETVLRERGVDLGDDIVLDPAQVLLFRTAESFAATDFPFHEITKDLRNVFVPLVLARSVSPAKETAGWTVSPILRTSADGWGERDLAHLSNVSKGPSDLPGPVPVAVAAEKTIAEGKAARIVAIGDSDLAQNEMLGASGSLDLLLNSIHWLLGKTEQIGITPREPEHVQLALSPAQQNGAKILSVFVMPGAAILAGVLIWSFRRR